MRLLAIGTLRPTGREAQTARNAARALMQVARHGAEGSRTPDLCSAIAALSQLSYSPSATRATSTAAAIALGSLQSPARSAGLVNLTYRNDLDARRQALDERQAKTSRPYDHASSPAPSRTGPDQSSHPSVGQCALPWLSTACEQLRSRTIVMKERRSSSCCHSHSQIASAPMVESRATSPLRRG